MPHNDENWLNGKIEHIKRTEQDILKDFEELGYKIEIDEVYKIIRLYKNITSILIFEKARSYEKYYKKDDGWYYSAIITHHEHKLLNELFTVWGWLDE